MTWGRTLAGLALLAALALSGGAGSADDGSSASDKVADATALSTATLAMLGLGHPDVVLLPGQDGAFTDGNVVYVGDQLANLLSVEALAQIILHEVGHVQEGHVWTTALVALLVDTGLLPADALVDANHGDELSGDVYAALGAWLFDPNPEWPAISDWLVSLNEPPSDTHPASLDRAIQIALLSGLMQFVADTGGLDGPDAVLGALEPSAAPDATDPLRSDSFWQEGDDGWFSDSGTVGWDDGLFNDGDEGWGADADDGYDGIGSEGGDGGDGGDGDGGDGGDGGGGGG